MLARGVVCAIPLGRPFVYKRIAQILTRFRMVCQENEADEAEHNFRVLVYVLAQKILSI